MSCICKEECPCWSEWCEGPKQDFSRCIPFLINAYKSIKGTHKRVSALDNPITNVSISDETFVKYMNDISNYLQNRGLRGMVVRFYDYDYIKYGIIPLRYDADMEKHWQLDLNTEKGENYENDDERYN